MDESIGEECKPGSKDIIVMVDSTYFALFIIILYYV